MGHKKLDILAEMQGLGEDKDQSLPGKGNSTC